MKATLPPSSRMPALLQTIGWWVRPLAYPERLRARLGTPFTLKLFGQPDFVVLTDPDEIRELLTAPPEVLHPGEGASVLEPIVGANSLILLDEGRHMAQRKLLLPAFHGDRMQRLTGLMAELTDRELAAWPTEQPDRAAPAPAGADAGDHPARGLRPRGGPRLDRLRTLMPADPDVRRVARSR